MALTTLEESLDLDGRLVFLRVDANVPLDNGAITDDGRIRAFLPTLKWLTERGASVVIASHLGRPQGPEDHHLSAAPVAARTSELAGFPVPLIPGVTGDVVWSALEEMKPGEAVFLENLRFDARETSKEDSARLELAMEWASTWMPVLSMVLGLCIANRRVCMNSADHTFLRRVLGGEGGRCPRTADLRPERPYTVVLGGSKVSDKLGVIEALLPTVDRLVIGGGMVFTVLAAQGHAVGKSLLEKDHIEIVRGFLDLASKLGVEIVLPTDIVMADSFSPDAPTSPFQSTNWSTDPRGQTPWGSILEKSPRRPSRRQSRVPKPCFGTVRWGSSSLRPSRRGLAQWQRR